MDVNVSAEIDTTTEAAQTIEEMVKRYEIDGYRMHVFTFALGNVVGTMGADEARRFVEAWIVAMSSATFTASQDGIVTAHKHPDPPKPPVA